MMSRQALRAVSLWSHLVSSTSLLAASRSATGQEHAAGMVGLSEPLFEVLQELFVGEPFAIQAWLYAVLLQDLGLVEFSTEQIFDDGELLLNELSGFVHGKFSILTTIEDTGGFRGARPQGCQTRPYMALSNGCKSAKLDT